MFANLQSPQNLVRSTEPRVNNPERLKRVTLVVACCFCVASGTAGYLVGRVYGGQHSGSGTQLVSAQTRSPVEARASHGPTSPSWGDSVGDGTPDFLRLDDAADRKAFRSWFASIAEFQALRPSADVPREISDCAALLRYAYRNTLRTHDQAWVNETGIEPDSAPAAIRKYRYPLTPLGAGLFRISAGPLVPDDLSQALSPSSPTQRH